MNTAIHRENRFENDARRYASYLETPEGRLRADVTFANLKELLPVRAELTSVSVLDVGCGTGSTAVELAKLGMTVALFDSSAAMLELAETTIKDAGVRDHITFKFGDAAQLPDLFPAKSFDLILCHNVLEYVDAPDKVLRGIVSLMRNSDSTLSVLVRNQAGEVLKAALQAGDLSAAEQNLDAEWGNESLYGGKVRLFTVEALDSMLKAASLRITVRRGVRVMADYLPGKISRSAQYERIFSLERKLGQRQEFFGMARYMHCLARPVVAAAEADE